MRLITNAMACGLLAVGLWSCSNDEPGGGVQNPGAQGDLYAKITIDLPTRSATNTPDNGDNPSSSDNGFEVGKDFENNVNNILVILAKKGNDSKYTFVAQSVSNAILDQSYTKPVYSLTFQSENLEEVAKNEAEADRQLYVFTYCNPSDALQSAAAGLAAGAEFVDIIGTIAGTTGCVSQNPYEKKAFLMTNAFINSVTLDAYNDLVKNHNTPSTAFDLGAVKVERVASRFDFMSKPAAGDLGTNQYAIKDPVSGMIAAVVEVNGMALFNEAKDYYLLPRMLHKDATTPEICGYELPTSWVVSPNAAVKNAYANDKNDDTAVKALFNDHVSTLPNAFTYTTVSSLADQDNDGWTDSANTDYRIWRYATENTLPSTDAMLRGQTTGIIFRAEIKPYTDTQTGNGGTLPSATISDAITAGETLYAFSDAGTGKAPSVSTMLGSAKDVYKYAQTHISSTIRRNFVAAVKSGFFTITGLDNPASASEDAIFAFKPENVQISGLETNMQTNGKLQAANHSFIVYAPDNNGKYYCYYYYYNRHNDNGNLSETGTMEYGTVRNNIYKLSVNTVSQFGLPGDIPDTPDTPDETPKVFFKVAVKVLDWVVRVNGIDL